MDDRIRPLCAETDDDSLLIVMDVVAPDGPVIATVGVESVHGLTIVTRNVKDFADLDVPLVNPWS